MRWMAFVGAWMVCAKATAGVIYNDGGTHVVNSSSADITLNNSGTTLVVVPGAEVTGAPDTLRTVPANGITANLGTTIIATGGQSTGGAANGVFPGFETGGAGIYLNSGSAIISGGAFTGGSGESGGAGLFQTGIDKVPAVGQVIISGGTFTGGNSPTDVGGFGIYLIGNATISGGTFTPGIGASKYPRNFSLEFVGSPGSTLLITGGVFNGGWDFAFGPGVFVDILGSGLNYDVTTRVITGNLRNGDAISVTTDLGPPTINTPEELRFGVPAPVVPEPASLIMAGTAAMVGLGYAWRRRRRATV